MVYMQRLSLYNHTGVVAELRLSYGRKVIWKFREVKGTEVAEVAAVTFLTVSLVMVTQFIVNAAWEAMVVCHCTGKAGIQPLNCSRRKAYTSTHCPVFFG